MMLKLNQDRQWTFEVLALDGNSYRLAHSLGLEDAWEFEGRRLEMDALFAPLPAE